MSLPFDHHADGGNNNCDSIRDWDAADKTLYSKITARATAVPKHHLDVIYPIVLPANFSGFQGNAFALTYKTVGSSAFVSISKVVDSNGAEQTSGLPSPVQSATKATLTVPSAMLTGTFLANSIVYVFVRGEGDVGTPFTAETCFIGPMQVLMQAAN